MLYEPVQANPTAKEGKKLPPFDFTILLKKLREKIKEIHVKNIGHGEVDSKNTLTLLNVSISPA